MRLVKLLQFIAACAMALAGLGVQARLVENAPLEKIEFISIECARVWMAQVVELHQENAFTYGESVSVSFNLRYPGQYFDKESGLSYNYFRSYDSRTGRYTQSDPIDLAGGWNKFVYVGGNPLSWIDPHGLAIECTTVLNLGIVAVQKCTENGQTPTEQDAKDSKRMSDKTLKDACKNNGYEDAHALKKDLGLDSKSDIFSDKNGNMYSGPRKGTGTPEYLHMNTSGIAPAPKLPVPPVP